jgi:hypothetical protein
MNWNVNRSELPEVDGLCIEVSVHDAAYREQMTQAAFVCPATSCASLLSIPSTSCLETLVSPFARKPATGIETIYQGVRCCPAAWSMLLIFAGKERAPGQCIYNLRRKIDRPAHRRFIITHHHMGYRFGAEDELQAQ